MCDELGPKNDYMQQYIEEYGGTSLCSAVTGAGCSEKEVKFAEKFKAKSIADVEKQITRLTKMKEKKMKPSLKAWIIQRLSILKQLKKLKDTKDEL
mmetsp:Transcript_1176/g.1643  ORF Transcript_1176/g.1643 Transcript_1176/m.1643 type:complete len:96 (+) Transcript_1176:236-523(+)